MLFRNGVPMVDGLNYRFGYNPTSGIVRLTPLAGIWANDAVYTVRFLNSGRVRDQLPNTCQLRRWLNLHRV